MKRHVFVLLAIIGSIIVIVASGPVGAQDDPAGNWLHFGYDGAYTAYNPAEAQINPTTVSKLEQKWGIGCDDGMFSVIARSPAIHDGKLFVSSAGGVLDAYDAKTGEKLWSFGSGDSVGHRLR